MTMIETDQSVAEVASNIFVRHPHLSRRNLACRTENRRLILEGEVNSFFEKQLAQEALRDFDGLEVDNQLTVTSDQPN